MNIFDKLRDEGIYYTKSGDYVCPKCSADRKKSNIKCFHIEFRETGVVYRCNHCGYSGGFYHDNFKGEVSKKVYVKPEAPKLAVSKEAMYSYLNRRCISKKTADLFDVGFNDKKEIVMPLYKNGELVNVKYRGEGKHFRQEKDSEPVLYGMKAVEDMLAENMTDTLVWTEGEFDCMSFAEIGIPAVSVPAGASSTKMEYIDNCINWINGFTNHIIAVDSDDAGKQLRDNLIIRLGREKCKIIKFEDYGVKDANELLIKNKDLLTEAHRYAKFLSLDRTISYNDVKHSILELYNNKQNTGISTGWMNLDNLFRIKKGKLMIITGYPSRGKSFFVDNLLLNLSEKHNFKNFLFTFENDPKHHFARMCSMITRKGFFGNQENKVSEKEILEQIEYLNEHFLFSDNTSTWNLEDIINKAQDMIRYRGVDTILIDPFDRIEIPNESELYLYIKNMLSKLSAFAKKNNVLVIFIAHPKKPDGEEAPSMYQIAGSTAWYNAADYGIVIHRDRNSQTKQLEDKTRVIVAKVKDIDMGNPSGGEASLIYDRFRLKEDYEEFSKSNSYEIK